MIKAAFLSLVIWIGQSGAHLEDPKEEARAQDLMREIRCVACENEPISQSGSDIAADMRDRVRGLVSEGKTDAEVRAWFVERYGEFVLFRPDAEGPSGVLLWGLPFLLLVGGGLFLLSRSKNKDEIEVIPVDHDNDIGT